VSTAQDLAKLVEAAHAYPKIRDFTTSTSYQVKIGKRKMRFGNTNNLARSSHWDIGLSKTGYIAEAGRCLVMQVTLTGRSIIIVLLDSWGKYTRVGDATRIRQWLEFASSRAVRSSAGLVPAADFVVSPRSTSQPGQRPAAAGMKPGPSAEPLAPGVVRFYSFLPSADRIREDVLAGLALRRRAFRQSISTTSRAAACSSRSASSPSTIRRAPRRRFSVATSRTSF